MLYNNPKSLLDSVSKVMTESKAKYDKEQAELAEAQKQLWEKKMGKKPLHPNQQKIDVHEPEKDEITAKDFEMLRAGKKAMKKEEAEQVAEKKNMDTPGQHQCAVHVKNEQWGMGKTIHSQHAEPDAHGNIAWYDVMFEHGIEKQVPTSNLEILVSEAHKNHRRMAEEIEQVQELKASTLGKYIKKASADAKSRGFDAGYTEGDAAAHARRPGEGVGAGVEQDAKAHKRLAGVKRATDKLVAKAMKEQAELDEARGRPRKNPLPAGSDSDQGEEPDHNIVMHLKKSVDTEGNHDVKFADKSSHKVPSHVAKNVLNAMGKLKPADRLEIQKHIGQSHSNLMQVHGMIK